MKSLSNAVQEITKYIDKKHKEGQIRIYIGIIVNSQIYFDKTNSLQSQSDEIHDLIVNSGGKTICIYDPSDTCIEITVHNLDNVAVTYKDTSKN
jgi:hypothetical protein